MNMSACWTTVRSIGIMQILLQISYILIVTRRVEDMLCYKKLLITRKTERLSRYPTGTQKRDKADKFPSGRPNGGSSSVNALMDSLIG